MGIDINLFAETWVCADGKMLWVHQRPTDPDHLKRLTWDDLESGPVPILNDRNYEVFSMLADLRNKRDYREVIPAIAPARGLPPDVSPEVIGYFQTMRGYSPSWLLLSELLAYDWDQPVALYRQFYPTYYRTRADLAGVYYTFVLPFLKQLGEPEDVRIVFWFD